MWVLKKTFRFEASHQLIDHDGKCAKLHGHSWVCDVEVYGTHLIKEGPKRNMVLDYSDLKLVVEPIIDKLDHTHLNESLNTDMPTSEYIAQTLYQMIKDQLWLRYSKFIKSVTIHETCTSECTYYEETQ